MESAPPKNETPEGGKGRRRSGARKLQILQTLAAMLEDPRAEKITTAALAARLEVSEAALYRHFASKAQMFEGLIEFIETTVFGLINDISSAETSGRRQAARMVQVLLEFAQTNRGMTRVLIGDALVNENERLQERMNQFVERVEASVKQALRVAASQGELPADFDAAARSSLIVAFVVGRWHRFAKTGFRKSTTEALERQIVTLIG